MSEHVTRDSTVTIESASPPYVECIHWLPRRLASGEAAGTTADVVIDQRVLQEMRAHARAAPDVSVGGLLVGRVFRDPTCSRAWVMVEAAERAAAPLSDEPSAAEMRRSLSSLPVPAGQVAVGWYRTHPRAGLYLSEAEAEYHRTSFPDSWQCAVVLLGDDDHTTGGVFQRTERGLSRSAYAPFYELVDPSSELGGQTCRTFSAWTSYETQASVAPAGRNGVSAELPPPARRPAPTAPSPTEPPASPPAATKDTTPSVPPPDKPASVPPPSPVPASGAVAAQRQTRAEDGSDEAWSKLQIQRSLTAVGRTLTPSALGELGAPAPVVDPVRLEEDEAAEDGAGQEEAAAAEPAPAVRASESPATGREEAPPALEPAPPDPGTSADREVAGARVYREADPPKAAGEPGSPAEESASVLVGGARRRPRRPPRKLAYAAATVFVMAAGIWVGVQIAGAGQDPIAEDPDRTGLAPAGIGIADQPLFGERSGAIAPPADPRAPDGADPVDPAPAGEGTEGPPPEAASDLEGAAGADEGRRSPEAPEGISGAEPGRAEARPEAGDEEVPSPMAPRSVAAGPRLPDPLPLVIDDPVVAAYEDALQIFGKEADRYDEARRDFDDGLQGCNPLNLAFRGVRESFERLSARFEQAKALFAGPGLRAFESAERQAAVIQRHYELTDCPPPIGG